MEGRVELSNFISIKEYFCVEIVLTSISCRTVVSLASKVWQRAWRSEASLAL